MNQSNAYTLRPFLFMELFGCLIRSASGLERPDGPSDAELIPESVQAIRAYREMGYVPVGLHWDDRVARGRPRSWAEGMVQEPLNRAVAPILAEVKATFFAEVGDDGENDFYNRFATTIPPHIGMVTMMEDTAITHHQALIDWKQSAFVYASEPFREMFASLPGSPPVRPEDAFGWNPGSGVVTL